MISPERHQHRKSEPQVRTKYLMRMCQALNKVRTGIFGGLTYPQLKNPFGSGANEIGNLSLIQYLSIA
jgi:hypothetical protein